MSISVKLGSKRGHPTPSHRGSVRYRKEACNTGGVKLLSFINTAFCRKKIRDVMLAKNDRGQSEVVEQLERSDSRWNSAALEPFDRTQGRLTGTSGTLLQNTLNLEL
jgi:hypothetical protein